MGWSLLTGLSQCSLAVSHWWFRKIRLHVFVELGMLFVLFCSVFAWKLFICLYVFFFIPTVTTLLWIIRCSFYVLLGLFFLMSLLEHYFFIFKVKAKIGRSLQFNYYKSLCEFALVFVYMHRFASFCSFFCVCVCFSECLYFLASFSICLLIFSICADACVCCVCRWSCNGVYLNR